jgi:hypothetical protein
VGSAVSEGIWSAVADGNWVSVRGIAGWVGEEHETRRRIKKTEGKMRVALGLDMSSILTESDDPLLNNKPSLMFP